MKAQMKIAVLAILCLCAFAVVISAANASVPPNADAAQVITTNAPGSTVKVTQFAPNQLVYVEYNIENGKSAVITIVDDASPANVLYGPYTVTGSSTVTPIPTFQTATNGYYYVLVNGAPAYPIAVASFFVVPESIFGGIAALGAGIAAFGLVKYKKINFKF
jgi:hypothetical protein